MMSVMLLAMQPAAEARMLLRGEPASVAAAAAVPSSSSASSNNLRHRKTLAAPVVTSRIVEAPVAALPAGPQVPAAAALPADAYVVASPCSAAAAAPGTAATAVFTVGASVNPQVFKEVALQVDYPTALYPSAKLTCQTSTAQVITCESVQVTDAELAQYTTVSSACMLGDLALTGPVTCTLSYTAPAQPLAATPEAKEIMAAITFAPLAANVVEDGLNNAAVTCVAAA